VLNLNICWHFHQPDYRTEGGYFLPWTYLHALKDYADMAAHLEAEPRMRAVVNFVPTLLEQLDDYATQLRGADVRDPLLAKLTDARLGRLSRQEKRALLERCFRLNPATMLEPFPGYRRLRDLWRQVEAYGDAGLDYLSGQYFADLVTWYHLAWTGETVRRRDPLVLSLMEKGSGFTPDDRRAPRP
jgi:alpha-amylase/alpha-mannosidase (GH57 family)